MKSLLIAECRLPIGVLTMRMSVEMGDKESTY